MSTRLKLITLFIAFSAWLAPTTSAYATAFWAPSRFSCGVGKIAILKFTVVNNGVIVGIGASEWEAGHTPNYRVLNIGTRTINTGLNAGFWQKWADPGNGTISAASYTCVTYLRAPINP